MSVTLNSAAVAFLLQSREGPVGKMLERTANVVAGNGEAIVNLIIEDPGLRPKVDFVIEEEAGGLQARVGIVPEGSISFYMAEKWEREAENIVPALMQHWDSALRG